MHFCVSSFAIECCCVVNIFKNILFENHRKLWFLTSEPLTSKSVLIISTSISACKKILQVYDASWYPSLLPLVLQHKAATYSETHLIRLSYRPNALEQNTITDPNVLLLQLFSTWAGVLCLRVRRMSYRYTLHQITFHS